MGRPRCEQIFNGKLRSDKNIGGSAPQEVARCHSLESVSAKWSTFIGIFENLEKMPPKSMELQRNGLKNRQTKNQRENLKSSKSVSFH